MLRTALLAAVFAAIVAAAQFARRRADDTARQGVRLRD
jgi:hypothetical protein